MTKHRDANPQGIPEGWVLAPLVATREMKRAGALAFNPDEEVLVVTSFEASQAYVAMLSARPSPPPTGAGECAEVEAMKKAAKELDEATVVAPCDVFDPAQRAQWGAAIARRQRAYLRANEAVKALGRSLRLGEGS